MGRVFNPETAGKERNRITKAVVLAIRELSHQSTPDDTTRDLAAFIVLALDTIGGTIDQSVGAWEKRGYWVKADRYRMEWAWASRYAVSMRQAVMTDDWLKVREIALKVADKLREVKIPIHHRMGTPWLGAYLKMMTTG